LSHAFPSTSSLSLCKHRCSLFHPLPQASWLTTRASPWTTLLCLSSVSLYVLFSLYAFSSDSPSDLLRRRVAPCASLITRAVRCKRVPTPSCSLAYFLLLAVMATTFAARYSAPRAWFRSAPLLVYVRVARQSLLVGMSSLLVLSVLLASLCLTNLCGYRFRTPARAKLS
jgi:hypothetical protein